MEAAAPTAVAPTVAASATAANDGCDNGPSTYDRCANGAPGRPTSTSPLQQPGAAAHIIEDGRGDLGTCAYDFAPWPKSQRQVSYGKAAWDSGPTDSNESDYESVYECDYE